MGWVEDALGQRSVMDPRRRTADQEFARGLAYSALSTPASLSDMVALLFNPGRGLLGMPTTQESLTRYMGDPNAPGAPGAYSGGGLLGDVAQTVLPGQGLLGVGSRAGRSFAGELGALRPDVIPILRSMLQRFAEGETKPRTIRDAIELTPAQRAGVAQGLQAQWGKPVEVPASLDLKPLHGFTSRVIQDDYSVDDLLRWYVSGADDAAIPRFGANAIGRQQTGLVNRYSDPARGKEYEVTLPVHSDAFGRVWTDSVIPDIPPNRPKKKR